MRTAQLLRATVLQLAVILSACGGGDPDPTASASKPPDAAVTGTGFLGEFGKQPQLPCLLFGTDCGTNNTGIYGYFVDGPTTGVSYTCNPGPAAGVTNNAGLFTCGAGDTSVSFFIAAGGGNIQLGQAQLPAYSGISLPVTQLKIGTTSVGLKAAEIIQALNHGTNDNLDVSGIVLPANTVAQINTYVSQVGTLPAGVASDDDFLAGVQAATARADLTNPVTGNSTTFMFNTVLPHLQDTIVAISTANPAAGANAHGVTHLTGTVLVSGNGVATVPGCNDIVWSGSGGGILNADVQGDISKPGQYAINFQSPGFTVNVNLGAINCPPAPVIPASSAPYPVSPFGIASTIGVTPAFVGNNLTIPLNGPLPAGCLGGSFTGTDVGRARPLITLTTVINCEVDDVIINLTVTAKMVDPDPP